MHDLGVGSPPRAWGRRVLLGTLPGGLRITPTGVGTAAASWWRTRSRADHPHGRGDGRFRSPALESPVGSPPRAWGRPSSLLLGRSVPRITPTGVGTAPRRPRRAASAQDHPHGRGDGGLRQESGRGERGSPPRAWGRRKPRRCVWPEGRITPTGVGTATAATAGGVSHADHPHGRGDGRTSTSTSTPCTGSPPRAWGRHLIRAGDAEADRITPTGVGTASPSRRRSSRMADHPHGRGDGGSPTAAPPVQPGSPPRAWGRRRR